MRTHSHFGFVLTTFLCCFVQTSPARADLWGISTDASYSRVIRFDHETGAELPGGIPSGSAGLAAPSGITVGPDGNLYVSSRNTAQILFYDGESGAPLSHAGGSPGVFANLLDAAPAQLKFGPDGNLYVSELFGPTVRVYDGASGARLADAATGLAGAGGLTFTDAGDLLVGTSSAAEPPTPAAIWRFRDGHLQAPFFAALQGEMAFPASLLHLPNGDLLAVDLFTDQIVRLSGEGQYLGQFAAIEPIIQGMPSFPADITFDPDGNLIVAVLGPTNPGDPAGDQGQLLRYDLEGNLLETIADELEQIGGLAWTPSASTAAGDNDGNGAVDVADYVEWKGDFGKWVAAANGADGNGNGVVDAADYTVWRDALGAGAAAAGTAVPEPSAAVLALVGAAIAVTLTIGCRTDNRVRQRE
jgi:DNA-binding beta-propeller fold protein YncE